MFENEIDSDDLMSDFEDNYNIKFEKDRINEEEDDMSMKNKNHLEEYEEKEGNNYVNEEESE